MMQWNPYLAFNGKCEAAFKFYEKCLGGKIVMMSRYSEMPPSDQAGCGEMPKDAMNRIMHARLVVGNQTLMGGDCPPGMPYNGIHGNSQRWSGAVRNGTRRPAEPDSTAPGRDLQRPSAGRRARIISPLRDGGMKGGRATGGARRQRSARSREPKVR